MTIKRGGRRFTPSARLRVFGAADRYFRGALVLESTTIVMCDEPRRLRVTPAIRAEAILVCAVMASADIVSTTTDGVVLRLDVSVDAGELADEAYALACAPPARGRQPGERDYEAKLRDYDARAPWGGSGGDAPTRMEPVTNRFAKPIAPATATWFVRQVGLDVEVLHVGLVDVEKIELALGSLGRMSAVAEPLGDIGGRPIGIRIPDIDAELVFLQAIAVLGEEHQIHLGINHVNYLVIQRDLSRYRVDASRKG